MPIPEPADTESDEAFGLHYPMEIALATWRRLNEHGALLEDGSYLDQPAAWQSDMETLYRRYARVLRNVLAEKEAMDGVDRPSSGRSVEQEMQSLMNATERWEDDGRVDLWER